MTLASASARVRALEDALGTPLLVRDRRGVQPTPAGQTLAREAQQVLGAARIVLQFPVQWYGTPAILKTWQDAVLTRMYYIHAQPEGARLVGTPLMLAASFGNVAQAYGRDGQNHYSVDEIFTPLKATARRCGLIWHSPHLTFSADTLAPAALDRAAQSYASALRDFAAKAA